MIVAEGIHCIRLFKRYKSEQQAEINAEREKLAAEKAEMQKMMQELLAMKSQLNGAGEAKTENVDGQKTH